MRRAMSQLIVINQTEVCTRTIVEWDEEELITAIFSVDKELYEPANTLFFDGIISGELLHNNAEIDPKANPLDFIKTHCKPIEVGKKNKLIIWQKTDLTNNKMGQSATITPLERLIY